MDQGRRAFSGGFSCIQADPAISSIAGEYAGLTDRR